MKTRLMTGVAVALAAGSFLILPLDANGHPCERDPVPEHRHCGGDNSNQGERIVGTATINNTSTIMSDGGGTYHDGDATIGFEGNPNTMDVHMSCQNNHFEINPGGGPGGRRIRVDFAAAGLTVDTAVTSCSVGGVQAAVSVPNTDMTSPDCDDTDPDWSFSQLLRAEATGSLNVCTMSQGEWLTATARFQTNLFHLNNCKGGVKKCGLNREGIDINYRNDGISADVTIACTADNGTNCTTWTVTSAGPGTLEHESGGAGVPGNFPIDIVFVAD